MENMFKQFFRSERESCRAGKRIIATSFTATVWTAINFFSLPIQAQSDYEGLGRRGTRIWGDRACNITGLASQEEITAFLDHCAPKYTPEEQAYLDMKTQAAIGLLFSFFFDLGVFQRPSPSVVRRVTDYVDEGISTTGTYRGNNGTRTITVQRRSSQIVIKDIKTGEIRVVNSRTGQLVDDVDEAIASRRRIDEPDEAISNTSCVYAQRSTSIIVRQKANLALLKPDSSLSAPTNFDQWQESKKTCWKLSDFSQLKRDKLIEKIKDKHLPYRKGTLQFEPALNGDGTLIRDSMNGKSGYLDIDENVWVKGPNHGPVIEKTFPYEWDVQLSKKGLNKIYSSPKLKENLKSSSSLTNENNPHSSGKYINIAINGEVSH